MISQASCEKFSTCNSSSTRHSVIFWHLFQCSSFTLNSVVVSFVSLQSAVHLAGSQRTVHDPMPAQSVHQRDE